MRKSLAEMSFSELADAVVTDCACGRIHAAAIKKIALGAGSLAELPLIVKSLGAQKPFLFFDHNTKAAAGDRAVAALEQAALSSRSYLYPQANVEADSAAVGQLALAFDHSCDLLIGVGSGTINDIGKVLAGLTGLPYIIVATAPSMDGYASATSSMNFDGVKISLPSKIPDAIIADSDIVCSAPLRMFQSGFGDMVAKYISLTDWRISHLVTGEYYCEEVADLVRRSLHQCMASAAGILSRDPKTATALMEGLIYSGLAMSLAAVSRPASGIEHYFSHIWDMRSASLGTKSDMHGLQCLIGSLEALRIMNYLRKLTPDRDKARRHAAAFDLHAWEGDLRDLLGEAASTLIELEKKEEKFALRTHERRLENIQKQWPEILSVLDEELPDEKELRALLTQIQAPQSLSELEISEPELRRCFLATKDIRDKYIVSRLLWDLGELENAATALYGLQEQ